MAHRTASELWVLHQGVVTPVQLRPVVLVRTEPPPNPRGAAMFALGVSAVILGSFVLAVGSGFLGFSLLATGGALAVAGGLAKRSPAPQRALPPGSSPPGTGVSPQVHAERSRRVAGALRSLGRPTFEALLAHLRWTEPALLETLVRMKEEGRVDEDLDLESGQWFYRLTAVEMEGSLTLEQRRARAESEQR